MRGIKRLHKVRACRTKAGDKAELPCCMYIPREHMLEGDLF